MLSVDCPRHGTRVLLGLSDIDRIERSPAGIEVSYTCSCGHHGTWLTGKQGLDQP